MKKFLSIFLFLLAMVPATIFAQVDNWDGTAVQWTHGTGTQADPYLIETAENLAWIAEMVNSGVTTYTGVYFKLTTDLDMQSIAWVPIGNSETNLFCGKFDGDNHFIDNISIRSTYDYKGLFGITGTGFRCTNLGVKTTISSSGQYCGGIIGYIDGNNAVVDNCYNMGSVFSATNNHSSSSSGYTTRAYYYSYSGGIVGYINGTNVHIDNCYNIGSISSSKTVGPSSAWDNSFNNYVDIYYTYYYVYSYSGGIIGYCSGNNFCIKNCYNNGTISSSASSYESYSYSGGIIGYCMSSANIEKCYNNGTINSNTSTKSSSNTVKSNININSSDPYAFSGGIVGYGSSSNLNECFNKSEITAIAERESGSTIYSYAGGIIGQAVASITNCYNRGSVSARYAGGLIGNNVSSSAIENSYNTGILTGGTKGGIRGNTSGTVTNCYYLETCGGTVSGGTSKTDAAMKSASFPILLNADSTVFVMDLTPNVNDGYPIFGNSMVYANTEEARDIQFTSATLHGTYYADYVDIVGFEYKPNSASNYTTVYSNIGSPASYNLTGLQSGTTYNYRMFVQKDGVTYYGDVVNFNTLQCNVTATIVPASASICAGDTAELTVNVTSSYSEDFTYSWSTGDTIPSVRITVAGTYRVTVVDGNGCSKTASRNVTVNPVPTGTISGNTSLCAGESSVLTVSGANSYTWNTGATTPTLTVNESGTYTCTFRNSYGCTSTQSVEVTVFSSPVITGETAFCAGGSTTLTASGGNSYTWNNGATTPSITVSTPGTYSVTGTSTGGCSGSSSVTVVQRELPSVSIYGTPVICSGIGAELTATEGSSYLWSTGETTQSITANHTGNYSVLVTDANGCSNTTSVEVSSLTSVSISGNTSICQGETATLSVEMEGEYLWSTGAQTSLISVSNAGVYSVTVSLPNGCSTSATANVNVNALPVPTITGNTTFCEGETTTLTANGGISYRWSNNATAASITVGTAGLYSVTVTDAMGCTGSTYTTIAVNPLPNVTISGNTATCQGSTTTLTANGAQSYQWNTGSTNATISVGAAGNFTVTGYSAEGCSNTASAFVTIYPTYNTPVSHAMCQGETYNFFGQNLTNAGTYSHTLYSQNGCDSIITLTLTVRDLPVVAISGNTTICEGETTTLTANGGVSYRWSNNVTSASISVGTSGLYSVTVTNAQGCSASTFTNVTVNPLPTVTISGSTSTCQGSTTTLTANGAQSYQWNTGSTNAAISVGSAGNFIVTGYSAQGCTSSQSVYVEIYPTYNTPVSHSICQGETYNFFGQNLTNAGTYSHTLYTQNGCDSVITLTLTVRDLPVVAINGNTTICQGETTTLVVTGGTSYQWSAMGQGNSITVTEAGTYTVTATNAQGCSATVSTYVTVNPLPNITISGNTSVCQGNTTTLVANGAAIYQWSNGVSGAVNTIGTFGIYTVTGISAEGCSNTASATVVVYQLPVLNISGDTQLCSGETTTLTANGAATYLWNNGTTDATLTTGAAGTYTVIGTDENGCYSTASIDVAVNYPSSTEISVTESGSYEWHDSTYTESGDYTWTGQTVHGCDSVVTLHLTITPSDTTGIITYDDGSFAVYPNPTNSIVTFQLTPETCNLKPEIQIFDIYGKRLQIMPVRGERTQIDLSSYAPGVYLIQLVGDGRVIGVRKVVKQ